MLHLPPGPGLLDLLARGAAAAAARQAAADRIRTTGCRPTPRSPAPTRTARRGFRITRTRQARLPPRRGHRRAAAARDALNDRRDHGARPRLPHLAPHPRRLAARRRPRRRSTAERAIADMAAFLDAGITTFDCADIYTGVEEHDRRASARGSRRNAARRRSRASRSTPSSCRTASDLARVDAAYVRGIVERSLQRLRPGAARPRPVPLVGLRGARRRRGGRRLVDLQREGKIDRIGGTNFDAPHTARAARCRRAARVACRCSIRCSTRGPSTGLRLCARERGSRLLCYGTVAGGFLSERWLGAPEPAGPFANRSLTKYKLIIDDFGGWDLFQELLRAARPDRPPARASASRRSPPAGCSTGRRSPARSSARAMPSTCPPTCGSSAVTLDADDRAAIAAVLARRRGPEGDTFALERDREGRHGRIMKYDLNRA